MRFSTLLSVANVNGDGGKGGMETLAKVQVDNWVDMTTPGKLGV